MVNIMKQTQSTFSQQLALTLTVLLCFFLASCSEQSKDQSHQAAIHLKAAKSQMRQGQYRAAMIEARNAAQKEPDSGMGQLLLAKIFLELGQARAAITQLDEIKDKTAT